VVRLAVARALAARAGFLQYPHPTRPGPSPYPQQVSALLDDAPAVADALIELKTADGHALAAVGEATARAYADDIITGWQQELLGDYDPLPVRDLVAARLCTAGAVAAWQHLASRDHRPEDVSRLAGRLLAVLPDCAEPGTHAASEPPGTATLAAGIAADLYATGLHADDVPAEDKSQAEGDR
jgi:hypothetical protein